MKPIKIVDFIPIGGACQFCGAPAVCESYKLLATGVRSAPIKICQSTECLRKTLPQVPRATKRTK